MTYSGTSPVRAIKAAVYQEFREQFDAGMLYDLGTWNRRKIAGTDRWSQHAWGNAWDIGVRDRGTGDRLYDFLRRRGDVSVVCWQGDGGCTTYHGTHIHVAGNPRKYGTPPGSADDSNDEEMVRMIESIQTVLKDAGYYTGKVDGIWGPISQGAFAQLVADAKAKTPEKMAISGIVSVGPAEG